MLLSLFILILTLILLFVLKFIFIPWRKVNSYKREEAATYFFPLLGLFYLCDKNVYEKGDFMANSKESSKLFPKQKYIVTNLLQYPVFFLRDPQYFRDFLQKPHLYEKTDMFVFSLPLAGRGLVFSEGETWKIHRKIISNSFHYEFLKSNIPLIEATTNEFFDKVTPSDYKGYPIIPKVQQITGEIVGRMFFGNHLNKYIMNGRSLTIELAELVSEVSLLGKSPLILLFGERALKFPLFPEKIKLWKRIQAFRKLCSNIINERRESKEQDNTLLSALLTTQKSEDPEQRYSDEDIVNEFITFFVAGMDTTGHLIGMTLYNLTQYPQYLKDLEEERKETFLKGINSDNLQKMDILHSLLKETLRFYTPGPFNFFRVALEDHKIHDLEIKKGQLVTSDNAAVFFNEKYFPNPEKFDPTRWTKGEQKIDPYAFIPFSAGPRNCIGQHLALIEAKVIISEFLERFDFKLKEGYQLRMTLRFLYEPVDELLFDLTCRHTQQL